MAKDARALRDEAAAATAAGKYKRALGAYLELERLDPKDAQWAKRAGETYRRLGNQRHAIEAFNRAVDRYAQNGFLVQAIAVCKLILQLQPDHADTLRRLAQMNEQIGAGPSRVSAMAENNPALHSNPNVAALRTTSSIPVDRRSKPSTPPIAMPRTKSKPINLEPGAALESVQLSKEVPESSLRETSEPGIHVIPIDDAYAFEDRPSALRIEIDQDSAVEPELDELDELDLDDLDEVPLPVPRPIGQVARRALAATPLFAGLPSEALEALVEHLDLVTLESGDHLYREGEPGDALYVIVEGEVALQAEGPPRVEIGRLGPGAFLGEVALMTDQPRSATVTAITPAELLKIDRVTLSTVLGTHGDLLRAVLRFVRERLVERWMRTSPLFRPFDDADRAALVSRFSFLEIDAGTRLLKTGDRPDGLYIVLAGTFHVVRDGARVAILGPGDLIGESALLGGRPFRSDVIAHGKSLALCLPADQFREVIMTHPHVLAYMSEQAEHSRLQLL